MRSQIYIALITYLLLYLYRQTQAIEDSFALCLVTLKTALFQRPETDYRVAKRRKRERDALLAQQPQLAF